MLGAKAQQSLLIYYCSYMPNLQLVCLSQICSEPCKEKTLGLIQAWSSAFRGDSKYKAVQDTYNLMKLEGTPSCRCQLLYCIPGNEWTMHDCL